MMVLREQAAAKINLYLHITGRRADGYHLLDGLAAFTDAADMLEVTSSDAITLEIDGPQAKLLPAEENLVIKAAMALRQHAGTTAGAAFKLHKQLPVAAGIGGGSADAAAALRLLMRLWGIALPDAALRGIALSLGADVPACLRSHTLYMGGVGEILKQGPLLTGMNVVLANPGIALKTPDVFANLQPPYSTVMRQPEAFASVAACAGFLSRCRNDLQEPAIRLVPQIRTVLDALQNQKNCLLARMSGSGATCFGLFEDAGAARVAAEAMAQAHQDWWVRRAVLL